MEEKRNNLCISEILSRAFVLCRENYIEILKVIGIFMAPSIILQLVENTSNSTNILLEEYMSSYSYSSSILDTIGLESIIAIILLSLVFGIVYSFGGLVIIKLLDEANKGNEVNWKFAVKYVWERIWRVVGLNILVALMFIGIFITLMVLSIILTIITLGIGLIVLIPLFLIIGIFMIPLSTLFNSMLLVNDLGITDSIKETFLLFRKGYFWTTVGKNFTIAGITIGLTILMMIFYMIPFVGAIIAVIAQAIISVYSSAYLNVFVFDRTKPNIDNFGGDNFIDPII